MILFPQYATTGELRVINNVTDADVSTWQVEGNFGGGCHSWRKLQGDAEAAPKVLRGFGGKTGIIVAVFYQMQRIYASSFLPWLKLEALGLVLLAPRDKNQCNFEFPSLRKRLRLEYHRRRNNGSGVHWEVESIRFEHEIKHAPGVQLHS